MSQSSRHGKLNAKKQLKKNAKASSMSNRSHRGKKGAKDTHQHIQKEIYGAAEMSSGPLMADEVIQKTLAKLDHIITVNETVKKLPDYNSNLTVEQIFWSAAMRLSDPDPRIDEEYLFEEDAEPVSISLSSPKL